MLDAFKSKGGATKVQSDELQTLITASKEERAALSTMLTQVQLHSAKLAAAGKILQDVEDKAGKANARLDEVHGRLTTAVSRVAELEAMDARIKALSDAVARAENEALRLTAPDGEFPKHKEALQALAAQAVQARESLETLKEDQAGLDALRDQLRDAHTGIRTSHEQGQSLKSDFEQLRSLSGQLSEEFGTLKDLSRQTHDETATTVALVRDVEKRLGPLATLQDMSRTTEERMATLNSLAEHVTQKIKSLENQKHAVERAVVEANRLNEMVWAMEVQVNKLNEGSRQAERTEELIDRIEQLSRDVTAQLEQGSEARDAFAIDLGRLEKDRAALTDFVRSYNDKLAVERKEFESFDQRVRALQTSVLDVEKGMEALSDRERVAASLAQSVDQLAGRMTALSASADGLQEKQAALDSLQESLSNVDHLAKRTASQYESLTQSRKDVETLRKEIQEFYELHASAVQLGERLTSDRAALEGFVDRTTAFSAGMPALEARIDGITNKLAVVDEGTEKAANLVTIADDLYRHMTRLDSQQQFIDRVEGRLNSLSVLTGDVDRKLEEQTARRAEVDVLRTRIDGVAIDVTDVRQKLEGVTALQSRLLPLTAQLSALKTEIDKVQAQFVASKQEESALAELETRLSAMLAGSRSAAADAAERLAQMNSLAEDLGRSVTVKDALLQELGTVHGRQRDVAAQLEASDDQLERLEAASRALEQRHNQIAVSERKMAAFEARAGELATLSQAIDVKIAALTKKDAVLDAVRGQVSSVHEVSARSKADLDYVESHRNDVAALRERVDEVLALAGATETQLASIESRKKLVDEVQLKTNVITNMLEDVRLNLETLGEQKAVVDHVMDNFTRLTEKVQEAQTTLRSLQAERELAERIERGIKTLRKTAEPKPLKPKA